MSRRGEDHPIIGSASRPVGGAGAIWLVLMIIYPDGYR